ncbi:MAG TPA: outer membrane protein assembly factor BamD [Pyrinomonadaceae bacterium]|nr:outer membrane protein assembly factor BamD [Pyrinomonadaceae bacterium]
MSSPNFRHLTHVVLFVAALAATALGCVWIGTSDSVRFNDHLDYDEMERLPPLPAGDTDTQEDSAENEQTKVKPNPLLESLKRRGFAVDGWVNPKELTSNTSIDQLDALTALNQGSPLSHVEAYLIARGYHDLGKPKEEVEQALSPAASDANLKDNVAYLRAAGMYRDEEFEDAALAFNALARKYPHSEKREAALFMAAVATMKTSLAYTPTSGDEAHLNEGNDEPRPEVLIDDEWHAALAGFKRVMAAYPHGRYFNDARGWIAYLMLRKGDRAAALVEYYRMLSDRNDKNAQAEAVRSLDMVRHHATDDELTRVESQLTSEPQVALTYAYHTIYNYSIDPAGDPYPDFEEIEDAEGTYDAKASSSLNNKNVQAWQKNRTATGHKVVERVLTFSRRLLDRYPKLSVGGAFALRVAEANLELGDNEDAVRFAKRALQSGVQNNERAQALWTIGVAEHRLKHLASARQNLETLVRDFPDHELNTGARRLLAMVAEDSGDIDAALEQYIELNYTVDIAYFVDTLMTIDQLAQFIDRHPHIDEKNVLTYSLGLRYLRANRWNDARATFAKVNAVANPDSSAFNYSDGAETATDPKEPHTDYDNHPLLTHQLLMLDIQTANDLERLERNVARATDSEATAEAMYQLASYQYEASSLLFYNPILWNGDRYWDLSNFALDGRYRAPNESENLFAYMQEHETLARALKIYLEIVERYPRTYAARDALYTAAVCHERLSNYNSYWRDIYDSGLHAGQRMVTYTDVKAAYPNYQLPRGTYGWEPSRRTVHGGPGWAQSPKRLPRPSRLARIRMAIERLFDRGLVYYEKLRRFITFIFLVFSVVFTARIAKQNRKLLRPKIVRVRLAAPNRAVEPPWTGLFWEHSVNLGLREKLQKFLSELGFEFWELARDRGSRPILLRSIVSHSFLAVLVISLFWFLHFG